MMRPPAWYWIVVALLVLWGAMGCYACFAQLSVTPDQLAKLPPAQQDAWTQMPMFAKAAYTIGVVAGFAGSLLLALRRNGARALYIVSLAAVVVQFGWFFLVWHGAAKLGPSAAIFPLFIALVCLLEIGFAGLAAKRGWTR